MFAIRPGRVSRPYCLDDLLRQRWQDMQKSNNEEIEKRTRLGVPLDGLEPMEDYEGNEDHKGIFVSLRSVSRSVVMESEIRVKEIAESVESKEKAIEKMRADLETFDAMKEFIGKAVAKVDGFHDENGPFSIEAAPELTRDDLEFIDQNGLLFPLYSVAKAYQWLTGEEKKRFGQPQPLTSQTHNLIAQHVSNSGATSLDATAERKANGLKVTKKTTHVQEGEQSHTSGLVNASISGAQSGASLDIIA